MAVNVSVTFPEAVLEWIDRERGEIKRSTYVVKLLQQSYKEKESKTEDTSSHNSDDYSRLNEIKKKDGSKLPQGSHKVGAHKDSLAIVESKPPIVESSD
jgi:hypothetical protein